MGNTVSFQVQVVSVRTVHLPSFTKKVARDIYKLTSMATLGLPALADQPLGWHGPHHEGKTSALVPVNTKLTGKKTILCVKCEGVLVWKITSYKNLRQWGIENGWAWVGMRDHCQISSGWMCHFCGMRCQEVCNISTVMQNTHRSGTHN